MVKLPDCNLYRRTNNLTPDPSGSVRSRAVTVTLTVPIDQGSRVKYSGRLAPLQDDQSPLT